jgi:hypothetical protein
MHLVLSLAALAGGVGLASYGVWVGWAGWRTARWPRVQGEIIQAFVLNRPVRGEEGGPPPELALSYRYEIDGKTYFGERLRIGGNVIGDGPEGGWYRKGGPAWVAYDPRDPRRCVLDPGMDEMAVARRLVPGAALVAIGALGLLGII